jgi:hypothetical protein
MQRRGSNTDNSAGPTGKIRIQTYPIVQVSPERPIDEFEDRAYIVELIESVCMPVCDPVCGYNRFSSERDRK